MNNNHLPQVNNIKHRIQSLLSNLLFCHSQLYFSFYQSHKNVPRAQPFRRNIQSQIEKFSKNKFHQSALTIVFSIEETKHSSPFRSEFSDAQLYFSLSVTDRWTNQYLINFSSTFPESTLSRPASVRDIHYTCAAMSYMRLLLRGAGGSPGSDKKQLSGSGRAYR